MQAEQVFAQLRALLQDQGEPKARALVQAALARLDLVSREEFDAQAAVLARTRARLEALEQQLAQLQAQRNQA